ncbi:MAG: putative toxin-antitoxin system toxin component, PIN family [Candidatus Omnitrophica bacterium]|nr:putative toxin-antitoxin system toxin component, PIN family [Candidatus Omnitrophota bacterium]
MLKVVIDTNQFVSAFLNHHGPSADLLQCWRRQQFILVISPAILREIKKVLDYSRIKQKYFLKDADIQALFVLLEQEAVLIPYPEPVRIIKDDPDDDKFIACALAADADYIVSGDRHLLDIGKYQSIKIVKVRDFLGSIV